MTLPTVVVFGPHPLLTVTQPSMVTERRITAK